MMGMILGILVGFVSFALYIKTLYASIPGGDSGELLAESCHLGQAHPPGYPLFTLLNHVVMEWVSMPEAAGEVTDTPAWKANALSAFCSALSVGILCCSIEILVRLYASKPSEVVVVAGCLFGSLSFGFSELVWQYSVGAEVFALNNFFVSLLLYLTLAFAQTREEKYVSLGALVCGLALTNHHMIVLLEVPLILWMLALHRHKILRNKSLLLKWGALFFFGLVPYVYLPIVSTFNKQPGSWGDSSTIQGLWHHVRRGDYGTLRLYSNTEKDSPGAIHRLHLYAVDLCTRQGLYVIPLFTVAGILWTSRCKTTKSRSNKVAHKKTASKRKRKKVKREKTEPLLQACKESTPEEMDTSKVALVIAVANMFALFIFHYLSNLPLRDPLLYGVQARFWMQPNLVMFLFAGSGFSLFFHKLSFKLPVLSACALPIAMIMVFVQIQKNLEHSDQSSNRFMEDYGRSLLETLPPKSLFLTNYDNQWTSVRYLQRCLGVRLDVTCINLSMMTYGWWAGYREAYEEHTPVRIPRGRGRLVHSRSPAFANGEGFNLKMFLDANIDQFPGGIYFGGPIPYTETDKSYTQGYTTFLMGLLKRLYPAEGDTGIAALGFDEWLHQQRAVWKKIDDLRQQLPNTTKYTAETWEWTTARDYYSNLEDYIAIVLEEGIRKGDLELVNTAAVVLERAFAGDSEITCGAVKNLGLAYVKLVQLSKGKQIEFRPANWLDTDAKDWRAAASIRALQIWSHFIQMEGAKDDADYANVESVVAHLKKSQRHGQDPVA